MQFTKTTFLSYWDLCEKCPKSMRRIKESVKQLDAAFSSRCPCVPEEMHIEIPDSLKPGETEVQITLAVSSAYTYVPTGETLYNTAMRLYMPRWHVELANDRLRTGIFCRPNEEFQDCTPNKMIARMVNLWQKDLPERISGEVMA